jgi:tetratricopeptide (TPR) repeat protein
VIAAALLLLLPFSQQTADLSSAPSLSGHRISSDRTLTGNELLRIGDTHEYQRHFPETLTYYQLALSTFREQKQARGVATALVKIARVYEQQDKFEEAGIAIREAVPILGRSSDRIAYARGLLIMGRVSSRLGQFEDARESLNRAVGLFDQAKERRAWNEALVQLGLLQVGDGSGELGLSLLEQARQDARTRQDRSQQLSAVVALGTAHWLLDQAVDARRYYEEGLHLAQQERDMVLEAALRLRLAHLYEENGKLEDAIQSGKRAQVLAQTTRDPATEAAALSLLAQLYRNTGQNAEADESEQRALLIYGHRQTIVHGGR